MELDRNKEKAGAIAQERSSAGASSDVCHSGIDRGGKAWADLTRRRKA